MPPLPPSRPAPPDKRREMAERILRRAEELRAAGDREGALAELRRKNGLALANPNGQMLLGRIHGDAGALDKAVAAFTEAARLAPQSAEAEYNRGFFLRRLGRREEALAAYDRALRLKPGLLAASFNRGVVLGELGRFPEALAAYDAVLAAGPASAEAHFNRGVVLAELGRSAEALAAFDRALALDPRHATAHLNRGLVLGRMDRGEEAVLAVDRALDSSPGFVDALVARGYLLKEMKRHDAALAAFDAALAADPGLNAAHLGRGEVLEAQKRFAEALAAIDAALAIDPAQYDALINRAQILKQLGRWQDVLESCERAIALDPARAPGHYNRAIALFRLCRSEEAIAGFEAAAPLMPDPDDALNALFEPYQALGRMAEADALVAERALRRPDDSQARFNRGAMALQRGDFARGWPDYEYRSDFDGRWQPASAVAPLTLRAAGLAGKEVLIRHEQGFGDIIQALRFVPMVAARARRTVFLVPPGLHRLIAPALPAVEVVAAAPGESFDVTLRLMSLPLLFGVEEGTIPAAVPYLAAEPEGVARWAGRIGAGGFRIGINWQGNPGYVIDWIRSPPLRHFAPLGALPGVRLISLQKVHGLEQLGDLPPGMSVESLGADYLAEGPDALVDAAAIMANLDLVVTSDSAMAHLAGALARPVFVAIPVVADWRWLRGRSDSPWYPTMRLFRQARLGEWSEVFAAIAAKVQGILASPAPRAGHESA